MKEKTALRMAVKTYYDFQDMRKRMENRMKIKADGTDQKMPDNQKGNWMMASGEMDTFKEFHKSLKDLMKKMEKFIKKEIENYPIWTEWLKGIKGTGHMMTAVMISEYDIEKATTVSKLWQFTGLNPGEVRGKKSIKKEDGSYMDLITDTMVRGDKLTPGFKAPFNKWLRTKMCGVLADVFIKCQNDYCMNHYYPYKQRLENSDQICGSTGKMWKEESKGHRDNAARRHMIKEFLKDLYANWRVLEGLPVRVPYAEEFLGKKHDDNDLGMVADK